MRTLQKVAICAALLTAASTPARSQGIFGGIAKKISDAASQKAEDKVNSKIDELSQKMVDNSFDAMFGSAAKPAAAPPAGTNAPASAAPAPGAPATSVPSASAGAAPSGGNAAAAPANASPFWTNNNAKTESSYNFDVVTMMDISSSKNTSDKVAMKMHYNTKEAYSGTLIISADPKKQQQGSAFVILDAKNQAMVMLMASDKSKFSMAYGWTDAQKYAPSSSAVSSTLTQQVNWDTVKVWKNYSKIGTKTIAGYSAEGYRTETADGNAEIWVSHDARLAVGNMFAANSNLKQMKGRVPDDYPQGMLMQMNAVNTKTGETVTMTVTSIETNANVTYNMADYPKMGSQKN